jgi:predicted dehydrogenase
MSAVGPYAKILGANDDIGVAVVGFRSRGQALMNSFEAIDGVRVVALCDADQTVIDREAAKRPDAFTSTDVRDVLARDDVDVVVSATPNHWHALLTVWACQAGKHVYIEKPVSHGIWEGRKMVEAARKYKRFVSSGFQNRSDTGLRPFFADLHAGKYGKVKHVHGLCYRNRNGIGKRAEPLPTPDSIDYNMWLGPAADEAIHRNQFHYDWHWIWNTGNGDVGNQGPHEMDLLRWAMGGRDLSCEVVSIGGRYAWDDAGETPNTLMTLYDFGDVQAIFEVNDIAKGRHGTRVDGVGVGVIIETEGGTFRGGRGGGKVTSSSGALIKDYPGDGGNGHQRQFIDTIRNGNPMDLNGEIEKGHVSSAMSHLANISYRVGSAGTPDSLQSIFDQSDGIQAAYERASQRLADNGVDLRRQPITQGVALTFDGKAERFTGRMSAAGNGHLKRHYRAPFVVPDKV